MLTLRQKEKLAPMKADPKKLQAVLSYVQATQRAIQQNEKAYYDREADDNARESYYADIDFKNKTNDELLDIMNERLQASHTNKVRYNPTEYVYPLVDLRPDGKLQNIYSGKSRKAEDVIKEDYQITLNRIQKSKNIPDHDQALVIKKLQHITEKLKYNCEHAVPQSWFTEKEPMRGDLHHLFTCEPACNSLRSNYPYHDFPDYQPDELLSQRIKDDCGKIDGELFEPEYGKGPAARAMLYFLVRYPDQIGKKYRSKIDKKLLLKWHEDYPPDLYEFRRNYTIQKIQGNRNPFIDFPEKMTEVFS
ncbi:endonuclease I family protein [Halobacillus campisalis]|uniref:Endonuclease I family protein n=1 Tax=Halobacillus campisalis TaxID=435909 RepID=A0ABW2K8V7_9BACI|nr:endonuclease [Halobacillus campisalis]